MALNDTSKINISLKKLSGKAQTSNDKGLANEALPSGITLSHSTIFGQKPPATPASTNLYDKTGDIVELVRFPVEFITGTDTSSGRHAFKLKLPSDYQTNSSNAKKGTNGFTNSAVINASSSKLQLIPPSYDVGYEAKPFYGGSGTKNSGTSIPLLDSRDWVLDYYNGILYQQDPPGAGDHSNNPDFVEAYLYIGNYLDNVISSMGGVTALNDLSNVSAGSPSNDQVLTWNNAGSTWQPATINTGTGVSQYVKEASGTTSAGSALVIPSMDFTGKNPTAAEVGVYLNGQLIHSGSTGEVTGGTADYRLNGTTGVIFGFDIENNDLITVNYTDTAFSTGKTVLLHTDDTAFSDGRVLTAGDGISISSATPRQLIVNNTGLLQRIKVHVVATEGYTTNDVFTVGNSINFSSVSYTDSRIDVYKNGVLLFKDVGFELKDQAGSLNVDQFKLIGSTSFSTSDRITVILF